MELHAALQSDNPPLVLDVRSRARYDSVDTQIPHSIRILPDQVMDWTGNAGIDNLKEKLLVVYCSCPDDATSRRVTRQLLDAGFKAVNLHGGFDAWGAHYPYEPKGVPAAPVPIALEA